MKTMSINVILFLAEVSSSGDMTEEDSKEVSGSQVTTPVAEDLPPIVEDNLPTPNDE
jgi:hypothetical protein